MYQPGSDALTGCPDNAPDDDGEELMEPVDGFRADCPVVIFTGKVELWIFLGELLILLTVVHLSQIQWTPVTVQPPSCCQIGSYMRTGLQEHVSARIRCTYRLSR